MFLPRCWSGKKQNQVQIGAGGAITLLSTPAEEYEEMLLKGQAVYQAWHAN